MFKARFSFTGRITRKEYLTSLIIFVFLALLSEDFSPRAPSIGRIIILVIGLWFIVAQGWKRSQDAGWHGIIGLLPYLNILLLFRKGDEGTNEYGPNPRKQPALANPNYPPRNTPAPTTVPPGWNSSSEAAIPKTQTGSFKCGACGAQNSKVLHHGPTNCQFCGAFKS